MTFIFIGQNERFTVQVSDRRLTANGKLFDDEAAKGFSLVTQDMRLLVGFTGLARFGTFDTHTFLLESLSDSGASDFSARGLIERTTDRLNEEFGKEPLRSAPQNLKHLAISFVGYSYRHSPPGGVSAEIGNRKDNQTIGNFRPLFLSILPECVEKFNAVYVFGDGRALDKIEEAHLREALDGAVGPHDLERIIINRVRSVGADSRTHDGVGKQLDVMRLHSDPSQPIVAYHVSEFDKRELLMPAAVTVFPTGAIAAKDIKIWSERDRPMTYGQVHRNAPCPCGSGKRYRDCHRQ